MDESARLASFLVRTLTAESLGASMVQTLAGFGYKFATNVTRNALYSDEMD